MSPQLRQAAEQMGENVMWLIQQILIKHDAAMIEGGIESIKAAVEAEREACAELVESFDACDPKHIADAIRARGKK